jgi:outer membrane protein assembly factor BamB
LEREGIASDAARIWRWPAGGGDGEQVWSGQSAYSFEFTPDGRTAVVPFGLNARRFDARTWKELGPKPTGPPPTEITDVAVLHEPPQKAGMPVGPLLVTIDHYARVSAWEFATGRFVGQWELPVRRDRWYRARLSADGRFALARDINYDKPDEVVVGEVFTPRHWRMPGTDYSAFAPVGPNVYVRAGTDQVDEVVVVERGTGRSGRRLATGGGYGPVMSGDGKALLYWYRSLTAIDSGTGRRLWSWNLADRPWLPAPIEEIAGPRRPVVSLPNNVALSPDGKRVAILIQIFRGNSSFHKGSVVALCDADTGKLIWKHDAPDYGAPVTPIGPVGHQLAFSPDGKILAVGTWKLDLFDTASGKVSAPLNGHRDWISVLRFTSDGKKLLSGSSDGTAIVWDMTAR